MVVGLYAKSILKKYGMDTENRQTRIDFRNLEVYPSVDRSKSFMTDAHKFFADVIYQKGAGISALSLAMKIYNAEGEEEYSQEETELIRKYANEFGTPMFIDAIENVIRTTSE